MLAVWRLVAIQVRVLVFVLGSAGSMVSGLAVRKTEGGDGAAPKELQPTKPKSATTANSRTGVRIRKASIIADHSSWKIPNGKMHCSHTAISLWLRHSTAEWQVLV